jgi:protein phosphatase
LFEVHGETHRGSVRSSNEDRFLVGAVRRTLDITAANLPFDKDRLPEAGPRSHLMVVADGMGGRPAGDAASGLAVEALTSYISSAMHFCRADVSLEDDLLEEFSEAIGASHQRLLDEGGVRRDRKGMGTTLTMAFVLGSRAFIAHVGDSRCYLVRDGDALRITRDQTVAQALADRGVLRPEQVEGSRWSNVLASVVGGSDSSRPDVLTYRLLCSPGDALVLCTDGLTKHVDDRTISRVVSAAEGAEAAARTLVGMALDGGGSDNVTVVVGRFVEGEGS